MLEVPRKISKVFLQRVQLSFACSITVPTALDQKCESFSMNSINASFIVQKATYFSIWNITAALQSRGIQSLRSASTILTWKILWFRKAETDILLKVLSQFLPALIRGSMPLGNASKWEVNVYVANSINIKIVNLQNFHYTSGSSDKVEHYKIRIRAFCKPGYLIVCLFQILAHSRISKVCLPGPKNV